jgi:hypothetical protein
VSAVAFAFVACIAIVTAEDATPSASAIPVPLVICEVWPERLCAEALRVSWCESRWQTDARNGQYRGLFQVSAHWRAAVPGFGRSAAEQARHALRVYRRTGGWGHWECRP